MAIQITAKRRKAILDAHEGICHYCGGVADHIDHIIPGHRGGSGDLTNLIAACATCNTSKGSRVLSPKDLFGAKMNALAKVETIECALNLKPTPKPKPAKRISVIIPLSQAELDAIDDWRFAKRMPSRAETIRRLIAKALEQAR